MHLEKPGAHARLLFADFFSAFNKMQPHILMERLASHLNLPDRLLLLILDVLTERVQQLLVDKCQGGLCLTQVTPGLCVVTPPIYHVHG